MHDFLKINNLRFTISACKELERHPKVINRRGIALPWPTTVTFLEGMDDHLPPNLRQSLQVIMSGSSYSLPTSE